MALRTKPARMTDRIEDVAAWVLIAAGLLVVLFSYLIGVQIHNQVQERGRVESTECTPAVARLVSDSTVIDASNASSSTVMVRATWQDRSGAPHAGLVTVPRGLRAGSTVAIWIDASGANVPAPTTAKDALLTGFIAGGMAAAVGIALLSGLWVLVRRAAMAANCAHWDAEWRNVAPLWSRGEGSRG
jgi:hypothetical protein